MNRLVLIGSIATVLLASPVLAQRAPAPNQPRPKQPAPPAVAEAQAAPIPSPDSRFTLLCSIFTGPGHYKRAEEMKAKLAAASNLAGFYLVRGDGQTTIYHGFYREFEAANNPAAAAIAQADKRAIESALDPAGMTIVRNAIFVPMESPDPVAPPEWDLRNAKGFYSLQIAAYKDHPDRKQAAVDSVRDMRKAGIDAYFFHGPTTSSVCVGAWPKEAVVQQNVEEVRAASGNPLVVLPPGMSAPSQPVLDSRGRKTEVVAPKLQVLDPTLRAAMKQYPEHALNGMVSTRLIKDPKTGASTTVADPSYLIEVPRPTGVLAGEPAKDAATDESLLLLPGQNKNSGGGLRSINSKPK